MSTGPCPKVPARWPSVQFGLPRPAGAGSMKPKPDKGGDPAKCLSADSSKHTPLPVQPTCTRVHTCTHTHPSRSLRSSLLMGLGVLLLQPNAPKTTVHSAEVQAVLRGLSKAPTEPRALLRWPEMSQTQEKGPQRQDGVMRQPRTQEWEGLVLSGII